VGAFVEAAAAAALLLLRSTALSQCDVLSRREQATPPLFHHGLIYKLKRKKEHTHINVKKDFHPSTDVSLL
jgi:hypothetical protein